MDDTQQTMEQQASAQQANAAAPPPPAPNDVQGNPVPPERIFFDTRTGQQIRPFNSPPGTPMPTFTPPHVFTQGESILGFFALAVGTCFCRYVLWHKLGVFTSLFYLAVIVASLLFLRHKKYALTGRQKLAAGAFMVFSTLFAFSANSELCAAMIFFLNGGIAYWIYLICAKNRGIDRLFFFDLMKSIFEQPFTNNTYMFKAMHRTQKSAGFGKNVLYIFIGLLITIPLTAIVASLLMRADDNVQQMLHSLEDLLSEEIWEVFGQFLVGIPVAMYFFAMLFSNTTKYRCKPLNEDGCNRSIEGFRCMPNVMAYAGVTPICVLYVLFFISQGSYFLSAFAGKLPDTFSYAGYARKGFFELCTLAVINLLVIGALNLLAKDSGKEKPLPLRLYSAFLAFCTLFMIVTAESKMFLYIDAYGLTKLRLYTAWFMLFLGIVFLLILIRQFRPTLTVLRGCVTVGVVMFGLLAFSRPEAIIARYNISQYKAGNLKELDIDMLLDLSDDAYSVVLDNTDTVLESGVDAGRYMRHYDRRHRDLDADRFERYNLSTWEVERITLEPVEQTK